MKELTVQEWIEELERALDYRNKFAREQSWNTLEQMYFNDPNSDTTIGPNIIYSEGDTLLSGITVPDPEFFIRPTDEQSMQSAPAVESLANSLVRPEYLNLKQEVETGLLCSYLNSRLILKIGYDSEFGWDPEWDIGSLETPWGLTKTQFDKKGYRIEFGRTTPGMPWVKAIFPHDFLVPWGAGPQIDEASWVAHRFIRRTDFLKDDKKYKNTANLRPQMSMEDFMISYNAGVKRYRRPNTHWGAGKASNRQAIYNECWEIRDRRFQKVYVICFTHDKFLRNSNDALQQAIGAYPYISDSFVQHPRHFWTTPLAYYLGQHQKEQFDISMQMYKQRRINVAKFLLMGGVMSDDEKDKLISGDVGATAELKKNAGKSLRDVIMPFPKTSNYDLLAEASNVQRNARTVLGQSRNQAGEYDTSSRRTKAEAEIVASGFQTRQKRKVDVVVRSYTGVIRKTLKILFRYWTQPRSILVGSQWQKFAGDQMKGRYAFTTHLQSNRPLSRAERKIEALNMSLRIMQQFPNVNMDKVMAYVEATVSEPEFSGFFSEQKQSSNAQPQMSDKPEQRAVAGPGVSNNGQGNI